MTDETGCGNEVNLILRKRKQLYSSFEMLPDPATEELLLPTWMAERDNTRRLKYCKNALHRAMAECLTPTQREQIQLFYEAGLRKSEIARRQQCTCSAVSKSIKAGEAALRAYMELYMSIYDALERDFLREEAQ